jgi:hypothetical protein
MYFGERPMQAQLNSKGIGRDLGRLQIGSLAVLFCCLQRPRRIRPRNGRCWQRESVQDPLVPVGITNAWKRSLVP